MSLLSACTEARKRREIEWAFRRKVLLGGCRIFARILLFFYGYVWIHETYEDDPRARRPSVVVCNHVGFAELLYLAAKDGCCFVSKEANRALPVIGKVSELMQSIFVDRGGGGRAASTDMLERARAPPDTWPPLAVCPEGTTTTGHCMIHFHTGAFRAGLPVQPVVVSLPFSPTHGYDPSFCCCSSIVTHILCLMMQPMNHLHVHHLAVHVPTDAERADPRLYANNVRRSMADALNVNVYELTWADKLQFEPTKAKRELGKRLLVERHGGVAPPVPVFTQDAFGNTLESAKDK